MQTDANSAVVKTSQQRPMGGAYFGLLLFTLIYYARPEDWIPGMAGVPLAKLAGIGAVVALALAISQARPRFPLEVSCLLLLFGQLCATVPLSPVSRANALQGALDFSKVVVMVILVLLAVTTLTRLRYLLFVQTASVVAVAVATILTGRVSEGRLEGIMSGNYGNSNDLAFMIVLSLPLCLVFMFCSRRRLGKAIWALTIPVMIYVVFLTSSRSGLICLLVAAVVSLWEFAIQGRRHYLVAVLFVVGISCWFYAGTGLNRRFAATFQGADSADASAYESSQQRWELLLRSLEVTAEHPLFGVGLGNFSAVSGYWHVTHNAYTQMSSEAGLPALSLFIVILSRGFINVKSSKRMSQSAELRMWARGLSASMAVLIIGSFFASESAYQFFTYFLVAYTTSLYRITVLDRLTRERRYPPEAAMESRVPTEIEPHGREIVLWPS